MRIQQIKQLLVFSMLVFALLFTVESSFAAKVCLQDTEGGFFELKGGKIDKKSYTVKFVSPVCVMGGYADATFTDSGTILLGIFISHGSGLCQAAAFSAVTNSDFAGTGVYDRLGDGIFEGSFTLSPVNCSSLPPSKPEKE